jgi:hypothetical protein
LLPAGRRLIRLRLPPCTAVPHTAYAPSSRTVMQIGGT